MEFVKTALAVYGASLTDDGRIILPSGLVSGVRVNLAQKGKRVRFVNAEHQTLYSSGPANAASVDAFVQRFWLWKKP